MLPGRLHFAGAQDLPTWFSSDVAPGAHRRGDPPRDPTNRTSRLGERASRLAMGCRGGQTGFSQEERNYSCSLRNEAAEMGSRREGRGGKKFCGGILKARKKSSCHRLEDSLTGSATASFH